MRLYYKSGVVMKKYLIIISSIVFGVCLMMFYEPKMKFLQKTKMGEIVFELGDIRTGSGFVFKDFYDNKSNSNVGRDCYKKGIVQFRKGNKVIYLHYDEEKDGKRCHFGNDKEVSAVFFKAAIDPIGKGNKSNIYFIETNKKIDLYVIENIWNNTIGNFYIVGRGEDGKYINYLDEYDLDGLLIDLKKLGKNMYRTGLNVIYNNMTVNSDNITVNYKVVMQNLNFEGLFRFDWNDKESKFDIFVN